MDSVTLSVTFVGPLLPSGVSATGWMSIVGVPSSFWMVPTPCPSSIDALTAFDRSTLNVSFVSFCVSPLTFTVTVVDSVLAGIVSVPVAAT